MEELITWLQTKPRTYNQGLALLRKYTHNLNLVNRLSRSEGRDNLDIMVYELAKLAGVPYDPVTSYPEKGEEIPVAATSGETTQGTASVEGKDAAQAETDSELKERLEKAESLCQQLWALFDQGEESPEKVAALETELQNLTQGLAKVPLLAYLGKVRSWYYNRRAWLSDQIEGNPEQGQPKAEGEALARLVREIARVDDVTIAYGTQIKHVDETGQLPQDDVNPQELLATLEQRKKSLGEKKSRVKALLKDAPNNLDHQNSIKAIEEEVRELNTQIKRLKEVIQ